MKLRAAARYVAIGGIVLFVFGMLAASFAPVPIFATTLTALICGVVGVIAGVYYVDTPPTETPLGRAADKMDDPEFRAQLRRAEGEGRSKKSD